MYDIFLSFQLLRVQLYQPHPMAFVRFAQEQQQRITVQFASFLALLGLLELDRHQGNVSLMEPGVAKIFFAKVK